jgi:hypothetical protein
MKQSELNRQVAKQTGESVATIKRLGFILDEPMEADEGPEQNFGPLVIDWDALEAQRHLGAQASNGQQPVIA